MRILLPLLAGTLLLATSALAEERGTAYRAAGTEPFWSLTIDRTTITYHPIEGRSIKVRKPRPIIGINGELYRTRTMTVDITHVQCSDSMSDRRYTDTVRVTIGRRTLNGCGGEVVTENSNLAGTRWSIIAVDGQPVRLEPRVNHIRFTADRIEGRAGCNGFGGTYRFIRDGLLRPGLITATQMACPGHAMKVESHVLAVLTSPVRLHWGRDTLALANEAGSITLRRER
ncbi:META domain-containing protein [Sphingomonas sp. DT-204]|uniref:META domain-containing protein n=1 Tax=Sphingomonas sp. DT-204 TaxID=3396166 RepID=UPI003F1C3CB2